MAWSDLTSNECISFNNAQNAITNGLFVTKHPSSFRGISTAFFLAVYGLEQMSKQDAYDFMYIDDTYSPYAAKSSTQLVVRDDLSAGHAVAITVTSTFVFHPNGSVTVCSVSLSASEAVNTNVVVSYTIADNSGNNTNASQTILSGSSTNSASTTLPNNAGTTSATTTITSTSPTQSANQFYTH